MSPAAPTPTDPLHAAIARFIEGGEGRFEDLALALFAWQRARNADYAALCADAPPPGRWMEIPPVPVGLFRDLALTSFPAAEATATFRTSGTTEGRPGTIRLRDTLLYDLAATRQAALQLGELPRRGLSLVPGAADSSLGHMCRTLVPGIRSWLPPEGPGLAAAWSDLAAMAAAGEALFLPTTAFSLDALLELGGPVIPMPAGSVLMVTGGAKGRTLRRSEGTMAEEARARMPGLRVVGEYGMSELSSPLWSPALGRPYRPAPWLRVQALDPASGAPLPPGREGILAFVDLANVWTVLAIETQDLGVVEPDGAVRLLGRLPGAPPRGCSLAAAEALEGR